VAERETRTEASRLTARGMVTRDRILRAAADLMHVKGVSTTTLDDVRTASGTSKSQLYRHFPDKEVLINQVVQLQARQLIEDQRQQLQRVSSLRGLERWRDALVRRNALSDGAYGCPLGSLASELVDRDDDIRLAFARHFEEWLGLLATGLDRMRTSGVLRPDADPYRLATGLMAALQGGYLLAQTARDVAPMKIALDMAVDHVKLYAVKAQPDGSMR
jgi:AcrR family transcriptional regulator